MEQSATADILRSVPPSRRHRTSSASSQSTPRLTNSEPHPEPPYIEDLSDSVLSLRFPKPLGNRQLTNWISSSSPDIMQPGNMADEDLSLAELGYDIIGTDGESQAESTASSFDYQRPDDIHSLAGTDTGTDVDTDSSDDEETNLNDTTISDATVIEEVHHDEAGEAETLNMVNRSLENPTSLSLSSFAPFSSLSYLDHIRNHELTPVTWDQSAAAEDLSLVEQETTTEHSTVKELEHLEPHSPKTFRSYGVLQVILKYFQDKRRILAFVSSLALVYSIAFAAKSLFLSSSAPRELSTVPVASVSVVHPSSSVQTTYSVPTPTPTISQTPNALQTASSPNGLMFIPFGKDKTQTDVAPVSPPESVCSAELSGRDEITIKIPPNIKSSWLAKDAILIAVSRGLQDIPTKMSYINEGFLIKVPLKEAHGVLVVTIATTRKPRINESFRINFGIHRLTEALDVGKQLVRGFAQRVVDTVNETTSWVEETYSPAFDVVSKQVCGVCDQTASVSGSLLYGLREASDSVLGLPSRLLAQMHDSLSRESMLRRVSQVQLELTRQTQDVRDELRMTILRGQLQSKLLWLRMQGKAEEYGHYISKAEKHWKEQRARTDSARVERAERTKKQIRAWHERDRPVPKASFWRMGMGGA
ncbi:hypothetical protein HD806DRAFT_518434 [Xylariaceae sp. AK1471]|nr:hypothetical protein HD806DRAFT_518434 [Xylariaceae sp. AK1471]